MYKRQPIIALKKIKKKSEIIIYTDSKYVKNGITDWIKKWKTNNWKSSNRKPVKNKDLWVKLDNCCSKHTVIWKWVKAHAGNKGNESVDKKANQKARMTHISKSNELNMVDVSNKNETIRIAKATSEIHMSKEAFVLVKENNSKKGNVIDTAMILSLIHI